MQIFYLQIINNRPFYPNVRYCRALRKHLDYTNRKLEAYESGKKSPFKIKGTVRPVPAMNIRVKDLEVSMVSNDTKKSAARRNRILNK